MKKRASVMVGAAILTGLAGCMDLNEDVISGLTPGAYGTEAAFQALVNATYEPLRSFWAQERGFTVTEFGTDIYTKGAEFGHRKAPLLRPEAAQRLVRGRWAEHT